MSDRIKNQSGLTLLEIMVTVVIVGIISAMAVPKFDKAIDQLNYTTAVRSVKSTIKVARSLSISDKTPYGVHFDRDGMTVSIFKEMGDMTDHSFTNADSVIRVDTLPRQFSSLSSTLQNDVILFRPNGSAEYGGSPQIVTIGSTHDMVGISVISVLGATGRLSDYTYVY